ncbi:MAG: carbohydrate binding family 9 domain-containing protein [Saprospiraceae bacterium]|nr:carbohydrate binding family 9 domain-containing protein [Saprospiraceae bacterium]
MKISSLVLFSLYINLIIGQDNEKFSGTFLPVSPVPRVQAIATSENIKVDGKLNESSWLQAPEITDFFRMEPRQGGPVKYSTSVKIVYDHAYIYFGVFCKDTVGKKGIRVQDLRRDFVFSENDNFYISIDAQNTKRFCLTFFTTPYGNQRDAQVFDDALRDADWDALWKVRTQIVDSGWYAEYAIPFSTIRYDKSHEQDSVRWGITFSRLARREYEQTSFPPVPQSFTPQRMVYAAELNGLKLPPPAVNFRVQPYILYQNDKNTNERSEQTQSTSFKPGGEIKWAINPHSVMDLTFNTDFAQADVDRAVNNLSRFNVFFPERRQFFLENNGIYAGADITNVKPFFSRSIGLANTQFNADPVPIDAGARYTDRNEKRTWASLYVHQRGTELQAPSNFGVARYLKNYGKQNNIGVMITHRLDESDHQLKLAQQFNTTLSIDGLSRPKDNITIQYMATASKDASRDKSGMAGSFYAGWFPQKWYLAWWTDYVDKKYTPSMGYVFANNTIHHNHGGYYIWRPNKGWWSKWIRRQDPGLFIKWYQDASTLHTQEIALYIFPIYLFTKTGAQMEYSITPTWQNFDLPVYILGKKINPGKYSYSRQLIRYQTDASRQLSFKGKFEFGGNYDGKLVSFTGGIRIAPSPQLAFTLDYQRDQLFDFGSIKENFTTDLYVAGFRAALNPRIQLSALYQYNSFDLRSRLNIRASWEVAPLSFIYLVFNENEFKNSIVRNQSTISKISYLRQF